MNIQESMSLTTRYFEAATVEIDKTHGEGFAMEHPQILAAFVQSALAIKTGELLAYRIESVANSVQLIGAEY
jgi:hypothetical protein